MIYLVWMPNHVEINSLAQFMMIFRAMRPLRIYTLVPHIRRVVVELCKGFKEILLVSIHKLLSFYLFYPPFLRHWYSWWIFFFFLNCNNRWWYYWLRVTVSWFFMLHICCFRRHTFIGPSFTLIYVSQIISQRKSRFPLIK